MGQQAIVRNEFVSAEEIDGQNVCCPRPSCQSNTLMLFGNSQVARVETLEAGRLTDVQLDDTSHTFELERIECLACGTRWHIKTREVVALEQQNAELRRRVIRATGIDPYGVKAH